MTDVPGELSSHASPTPPERMAVVIPCYKVPRVSVRYHDQVSEWAGR